MVLKHPLARLVFVARLHRHPRANGRLLVTVNKGIVNISNEFGNRDIGVGQTFQMQKEKAPNLPKQASWPKPKQSTSSSNVKKTAKKHLIRQPSCRRN
jgi:hypothetical protein